MQLSHPTQLQLRLVLDLDLDLDQDLDLQLKLKLKLNATLPCSAEPVSTHLNSAQLQLQLQFNSTQPGKTRCVHRGADAGRRRALQSEHRTFYKKKSVSAEGSDGSERARRRGLDEVVPSSTY